MFFYHGTSVENAENIKKVGFKGDEKKVIWNCSDYEQTYFYRDEIDDNPHEGFFRALESAQIAAAFQGSLNTSLAVVVLEVLDDSPFLGKISPDTSCEHMSNDAVCVDDEDLQAAILAGEAAIHIEVVPDVYDLGFRLFYISGLLKNNYFCSGDLPEQVRRGMEKLAKVDTSEIFENVIMEPISNSDLPAYVLAADEDAA